MSRTVQLTQQNCELIDLGLIDYQEAFLLQMEKVKKVQNGDSSILIFCEHSPIITMGRMADKKNILIQPENIMGEKVNLLCVDRGGDVTLHAPGQLVVYPIINLDNHGKDLHLFIRKLEDTVIDLLVNFDIVANRFRPHTGVWVKKRKIASIGIGVKKWVSYHGIGINVHTDLSLFSCIRPCGLDVTMTSMSDIKGKRVDMGEVKSKFVSCFERNFGLKILMV